MHQLINKMDKAVEYSDTEFFCQRFDLKLPQAFVLKAVQDKNSSA